MKTCQCCGAVASADAPACARCGEASWAPAVLAPEPEPQSAPDAPMLEPESDALPLVEPPPEPAADVAEVLAPAVLAPEPELARAPIPDVIAPTSADAPRSPTVPRRSRRNP